MAVTGGELLCTRNAGDVYIDSSSNKRHTPDKARSDLTMSLRGVALARGEDKVASVSHDDAIKQLGKKFAGAYRSRVYGSKVRRCASCMLPPTGDCQLLCCSADDLHLAAVMQRRSLSVCTVC